MSVNQYDLFCSQICERLNWKFKEVKEGAIFLEDGSFVTLSDCSIKLLTLVKQLEEVIGELKVDNSRLKDTILELRKEAFKQGGVYANL